LESASFNERPEKPTAIQNSSAQNPANQSSLSDADIWRQIPSAIR
jgi:hypothetical protein